MTQSYTQLKSFNSFNDTDILNQIQQTMIMFFDWGFLNKGAFTNILVGQSDINSNDQSRLRLVSDPNYTDGQVWETFRHNLVWESGLVSAVQPIQISGVYVNGTLRTPNAVGYEHYVDYPRGRVIFNSAIPTNSTVKMEYSYKTILFDRISAYPEINRFQIDSFDFMNYTSSSSGTWSSLSRVQLPLVAVEISPSLEYHPVDLGTGNQFVEPDVLMHIFDTNDVTVNKLLSFISIQKEKTIYTIDIDLMSTSGAFPIDYRGVKASGAMTYADLIHNGYRDTRLRFSDAKAQSSNLLGSVYHGVVRFKMETITTV